MRQGRVDGGPRVLRRGDVLAALQWVAIIVPPSLGMWVFGAGLVGVPSSSFGPVLAVAFFAVGLSPLLQLRSGCRVPVFEVTASIHLATVAVIAATSGGTASAADIMGGLLTAGAVVFVLGLVGADRFLTRIFTPPATAAFILALVVALLPEAAGQAIARSNSHPLGSGDASFVLVVAIVAGSAAYLHRTLRPFALMVTLVAAVVARLLMGWPAAVHLDPGWTVPGVFLLRWPQFTIATSLSFGLAGIAAAFNAVGSLNPMSAVVTYETARPRRELLVNGAIQGLRSVFGRFVGTIGHMESASVVRMNPVVLPVAVALIAERSLNAFRKAASNAGSQPPTGDSTPGTTRTPVGAPAVYDENTVAVQQPVRESDRERRIRRRRQAAHRAERRPLRGRPRCRGEGARAVRRCLHGAGDPNRRRRGTPCRIRIG